MTYVCPAASISERDVVGGETQSDTPLFQLSCAAAMRARISCLQAVSAVKVGA